MAFINISCLPEKVQFELEKANLFDVKRILHLSETEFMKLCNLSGKEVKQVKLLAAKTYKYGTFIRANDINIQETERKITTDCEEINKLLGGGFSVRGITELAGESGVGKTQICLQVSLTVQYPKVYQGLNKGAVYICTEDKFPSQRLSQLLQYFPRSYEVKESLCKVNLGDRIYIDHIADFDALKDCIYNRLPKLLNTCNVGLIIIDSIAAVFRSEYGLKDFVKRAADIREIGLQLHRINKTSQVAVICVNQVTDIVGSSLEKVPALGLAWANIVTTRLQAFKQNDKRFLQVTSSPDLPCKRCFFRVTPSGVQGILPSSELAT